MKKKVTDVPTFDELKDHRFEYHYSREERLKTGRSKESAQSAKGLARLFGGNKMVARFVLFYIALGVIIWIYLSLIQGAENSSVKKLFHYSKNQTARLRFIDQSERHGINLSFQNRSHKQWSIKTFLISSEHWEFFTNLNRELAEEEFIGFFIPTPTYISNLQGINIELNPNKKSTDKK